MCGGQLLQGLSWASGTAQGTTQGRGGQWEGASRCHHLLFNNTALAFIATAARACSTPSSFDEELTSLNPPANGVNQEQNASGSL